MRATVFMLVIISIASLASARTWRVDTAGTGDAPTLHAAMDSVMSGDIVLVEAGQYDLPAALGVPGGVQLIGESGAAHTVIQRDAPPGIAAVYLLSGSSMRGIHLRASTSPVLYSHGGTDIVFCIVEATAYVSLVQMGGPTEFTRCLLLGGALEFPLSAVTSILATTLLAGVAGSDFFSCDFAGAVDPSIEISELDFNFSLDPEFCGLSGSGNYFLKSTSPCLPENNPFGFAVPIGPLPMGCGSVAVEEKTWGGVKALYRDR